MSTYNALRTDDGRLVCASEEFKVVPSATHGMAIALVGVIGDGIDEWLRPYIEQGVPEIYLWAIKRKDGTMIAYQKPGEAPVIA